jgi:hypothetical protein
MDFTGRELGLLKVASSHKNTIFALESRLNHAEKALVSLVKQGLFPPEGVLAYLRNQPRGTHLYMKSSDLGIYTKIAPYTTKAGVEKLAHYTQNGKYYCSLHENKEPMSYDGWFSFNEHIDKFEFKMNLTATKLTDFFVVSEEDKPIRPRK